MRFLIGIPSPRDIPIFKEHIDQLQEDKLWCKYYKELDAYQRIRRYFLKHEQYTHLVICPDDLLVKPEHIDQLKRNLQYPVICGLCNIDSNPLNKDKVIVTKTIPHKEPYRRKYYWTSSKSREILANKPFQVAYAGFPLMCIRWDIVEQIPFQNDATECCIDVMFSHQCRKRGIPIMVDPRIRMVHLKLADSNYQSFKVGQRKPYTYLSISYTMTGYLD